MAMTTEFMSAAVRKSGTFMRVGLMALALGSVAGCDSVTGIFTSDDKTVLPGKRLSVMELGAALEVDPALADELVILPQPYNNPAWPQPGGLVGTL